MEVSGQLHAPAALCPGKEPQYPLDRKLVDPRAGLDAVEKRENPIPTPTRNRTPVV
jgi:hypothetical protein